MERCLRKDITLIIWFSRHWWKTGFISLNQSNSWSFALIQKVCLFENCNKYSAYRHFTSWYIYMCIFLWWCQETFLKQIMFTQGNRGILPQPNPGSNLFCSRNPSSDVSPLLERQREQELWFGVLLTPVLECFQHWACQAIWVFEFWGHHQSPFFSPRDFGTVPQAEPQVMTMSGWTMCSDSHV